MDLRLWCFACARGDVIDSIIWELFEERGWPMELEQARRRFKCRECGSAANVLILPARRPDRTPATGTDVVAGFFHMMRAAAKRRR